MGGAFQTRRQARWAALGLLAIQPGGHAASEWVRRRANDTEPCMVGNLDFTGIHCRVLNRELSESASLFK